jgi:3-isopropylmalate dehydrogenase
MSAAMLCAHLGLSAGAAKIEQAVADDVLARKGEAAARSTTEVGDDVAKRVAG